MRDIIEQVPIPIAGVALALTALGNLLEPASEIIRILCGFIALALIVLLVAKIVLFPQLIRDDLHNSIMASVSGAVFMTLMQFASYLAPLAYYPAFALWVAALAAHFVLIVWFTARFVVRFKLHEVFPTYFICYVGIVVGSATSPAFGMQAAGHVIFWVGFALYLALLCLVTLRYVKREVPEGARPLFCIYTAPMSLSIVGYLATSPEPNMLFVAVLLVLAQVLFAMVLWRLPVLLKLRFYPSYAAMTFPFVITATALGQALAFFRTEGVALSGVFDALLGAEAVFATIMVAYVLAHYLYFFFRRVAHPKSASVIRENKLTARLLRHFVN